MLGRLAGALPTRRTCCSGRATTSATSVRTRRRSAARCRAVTWPRAARAARALGIEANGTIKGCPSLATAIVGGQRARAPPRGHLGARARRCASRAIAPSTISGAICRGLLLRRRLPRRLHVDGGVAASASPGNNPFCHHRALELAAQRQARAPRAGRARARRSVRSGPLRDFVVEDLQTSKAS